MKKICSLLLVISLGISHGHTQKTLIPVKNITMIDYLPKLDSLRRAYGNYKSIPEAFKLQTLIALSYFPELKNMVIDFKYQDIGTTMACRPDIISIVRGRSGRFYNIFIDNNAADTGNILLKDVPFNAQVGVIAHELCHILDYEQMNSGDLVKMGVEYSQKKNRADVEKRVDKITIKRGLGWQLWDWSDFILNRSKATVAYKYYKKKTYLSPEEIKIEMAKNKQYKQIRFTKAFWRNDFFIEIYGVLFGLCLAFLFVPNFRKTMLRRA